MSLINSSAHHFDYCCWCCCLLLLNTCYQIEWSSVCVCSMTFRKIKKFFTQHLEWKYLILEALLCSLARLSWQLCQSLRMWRKLKRNNRIYWMQVMLKWCRLFVNVCIMADIFENNNIEKSAAYKHNLISRKPS